jgi:hypothetical protein
MSPSKVKHSIIKDSNNSKKEEISSNELKKKTRMKLRGDV